LDYFDILAEHTHLYPFLDPTGTEKDYMCASLGAGYTTWEPEDLWEYVWLATLMDDSKFNPNPHGRGTKRAIYFGAKISTGSRKLIIFFQNRKCLAKHI
jgi:hypothetical protein